MKLNVMIFALALSFHGTTVFANDTDPIDQLKKVAVDFIKVVDENSAETLKQLLHPEMIQYVKMNGKLIPFKAADFIQMVADKKLGGTPRTIELHSANILRGQTGEVRLRAKSDEYDFMYQVSLANDGEKWIIVGILVDILAV